MESDLYRHVREDALQKYLTSIALLKRIEENIASFLDRIEREWGSIEQMARKIKALLADERNIYVLAPTSTFVSLIGLEKLGDETYIARMEPPILPHFYVYLALLYKLHDLVPVMLIRTEPVLSLVSILLPGIDTVGASLVHAGTGLFVTPLFIEGSVSVLPFDPSIFNMPVDGRLYLTNIGFSTIPYGDISIEVDPGRYPGLDASKINFIALRDAVEKALVREP